jgi:tRNA(Ile)-lysidine synthase
MLESEVIGALDRHSIDSGRMLVAVSGGRDSMVLLDVLRRASLARGIELIVGHVNHGLRGVESDADEAAVRKTAKGAALEFGTRRVWPEGEQAGRNSRTRPTLEEASRNLRKQALEEMAAELECCWIATAHHAGDQAETVLMRLLRGTGPDGLAAMAPVSRDGCWLKPRLGAMPEAIRDWADREKVAWREDRSNQDRRFARNRLRHDLIPELEATFNPQILRSLVHLAEAQRRDLEWIEGLVAEAAEEKIRVETSGIRLTIDGWRAVPDALARRLVRRCLVDAGLGREITRAHLERMLAFLRLGREAGRDKRVELPDGFLLRRLDDAFWLSVGTS